MRLLALLLALFGASPASASAETIGRSAEGRELRATRIGDPAAPVTVLVVGSIHGTERAGHAVIGALRRAEAPAGVQVWLVTSANPDGAEAGTRQNARGVDLNRNFPRRWRAAGRPGDTFYPGPKVASEPETRAMQRFIRRIEPDRTIWFHQMLGLVNLSNGADRAVVRRYAKRVNLPARRLPNYRGTASSWQNHTYPASSAFVVELGAGELSPRAARRHVRAVHAMGSDAVPAPPPPPAPGTQERRAPAAADKPPIRWNPIPFGTKRRDQMRAYARRHYGLSRSRLVAPKVIVEHFTASNSFSSAFDTFAANAPDVELGERPGVCAHFLIDRDGTIHQLVRLKWMCRHTIGLNHVAFGIEHVGTSDGQVMGTRRQIDASLALTRWLQARHDVADEDVIGHAESLGSPHHLERVAELRDRTHGDFSEATMKQYRSRL